MRNWNPIGLVSLAVCSAALGQAPLGTSFTYQGQLKDGAAPADGAYDFIFRLYDASSGGLQVGSSVTLADRIVTGGLFTVQLDFGASPFGGDARWLDIQVRPGASTGAYTLLTPRQPLSATPYALYALSGPGAGGPWATNGNDIYTTNTGEVGIGTTSPSAKLSVFGPENTGIADGCLQLWSPGGAFGNVMTMDGNEINAWSHLYINPDATTSVYMVTGGGNVGVGTASPGQRLDVNGRVRVRQNGTSSSGIYFYQDTPAADRGFVGMRTDTQMGLYGTQGAGWGLVMDVTNGRVGINTTAPAADLHVNGVARVNVLEIVGADLAEKFPVSDAETPEPGMVLMIDAANPGTLCLAKGAYNKRVAGVVSGANGLPAGSILGHLPGNEDAPPVALSGRVWVWCDATAQAIEPGDMLTTSDTPGHAMAATDASRSHGAIIGKAMTNLAKGQRGLVLTLVNLQ